MKDPRYYGESFWATLELLHQREDDIGQSVAEPLLLGKHVRFAKLESQYKEASAEWDKHKHIDFCQADEVWPDQVTVQYREESGNCPKLRVKLTEYKYVFDSVRKHGEQEPYPRFFVSAGFPRNKLINTTPIWVFVCEFSDLLNNFLRLAAGELNDHAPSRQELRELGVYQRQRNHPGSWAWNAREKCFEIDLEAIHKARVKYYLTPYGEWVDPSAPQFEIPFK